MIAKNFLSSILDRAKIKPQKICALSGGANNRVFQIDRKYVLKCYFSHKTDPRPRLQSEFSFLEYAWKRGISNIANPLYKDEKQNVGIYSFIEGTPCTKDSFKPFWIQSAIDFIQKLNPPSDKTKLPYASEACLLFFDYFKIIEKKIEQLSILSSHNKLHVEVHHFLNKTLIPKYHELKTKIMGNGEKMDPKELCISPSDFGFHNAIIQESKLFFIDFEYAGFDDPVKLVSDFFSQPKISVPMHYFENFSHQIANTLQFPEAFFKRLKLAFPICRLKWCFMMLNLFTKIGSTRRLFSQSDEIEEQEKQFLRAKKYYTETISKINF